MNNTINFYQVKEMTDDEKYDVYMNVSHEDLVKMKIAEEKYVEMLENDKCCNHCCNKRTVFITKR